MSNDQRCRQPPRPTTSILCEPEARRTPAGALELRAVMPAAYWRAALTATAPRYWRLRLCGPSPKGFDPDSTEGQRCRLAMRAMHESEHDACRAGRREAPASSGAREHAIAWLRLKAGRRSGRLYLSGIMPSTRLGHVLSALEKAAGGTLEMVAVIIRHSPSGRGLWTVSLASA